MPNTQLLGITDIKYMYIYFVLGVLYQKYKNIYKFNIYMYYFTLFSLFLYPILINNWKVEYYSFIIDFENIKPIIYKYITAFSGILLIVGVLKSYYNKINFDYFERLGKYSIAIYILSDYFVEIINHFNSKFVYLNPYYKIPILILFTILICEISLLVIKITSRNKKLSMILWGNR